MATIPGQVEPITDATYLVRPVWYEWLLFFYRSIFGSWQTFTSTTMTATGGPPIGTVAARYRQTGRTIDITYQITISNVNGASGLLFVPLPKGPPVAYAMLVGEEIAVNGSMALGRITPGDSRVLVAFYNASTVLLSGAVILLSGSYEI